MSKRVEIETDSGTPFPVTTVAMVLIALSVVIKAWAAFGSWFYEDDFYFLSVIARGENDLDWYFARYNVHFMPLSLLLVTPVGLLGDFAWWAAALEITVLYAGSALSCWWMLHRLFGANPRILAPLTFYVFSPLLIPAVTWWATAINLVAVQIGLFMLIGCHVEYLRTRRRRWLALAGLMLVVISGVYVKGLVVTAVLGLFTLLYAVDEPRPVRRLWRTISRWWPIWLTYATIGLATIAAYVTQDSDGTGGSRTDLGDLLENLVLRNLVPGLVGGPWTWQDTGNYPRQYAATSDLGVAISLTLVTAVLLYTVTRWRHGWFPLVFLAPPAIATVTAMASYRVADYPHLSLEVRYWADLLPYLVLAFSVTIMAIPGLPDLRMPRDNAASVPPAPLLWTAALAYVVSCLTSTLPYVQPWHTDFAARQFVTAAVANASTTKAAVEVADVPAPPFVVSGLLFPYNTPNYLFAPTPGEITATDSGVDIQMLDPWGQPQSAQASADSEVDLSTTDCFAGPGQIDLEKRTFDFPFWVTITATFDKSTTMSVVAESARYTLDVTSGRHQVTFRTDGGFQRIWLNNDNDALVCPESVRIGAELEIP